MNIERDKFLTKQMGLCYHEFDHNEKNIRMFYTCIHCGHYGDLSNIDFSTWGSFGKLWEWSYKQSWFSYLSQKKNCFLEINNHCKENIMDISKLLIHPNKFADAIYGFLKGNNIENSNTNY